MDPVSLDPEHGEETGTTVLCGSIINPTKEEFEWQRKPRALRQYLVEYIATATVEQTQTALNFFTAIASQKIAANAPAAAAKPAKATKAAKPPFGADPISSVTLTAAALTSSSPEGGLIAAILQGVSRDTGLPETYRNGMRGSSGCRDEAGRLLAGNCCIHAKRYWHAGRS